MKKTKITLLAIASMILSLGITSCDESGGADDVCQAVDYDGQFIGKYWLLNLIELTNNDTLLAKSTGNILSLESKILGTTFEAEYNPETGIATVSNLIFPQFIIGGDTLFDISVNSGFIQLDSGCDDIFLNLSGVTVQSGTVNLPDILGGYPIQNVTMNTRNGLIRQ